MEEELILFRDYSIAMSELAQQGTVLTKLVTVENRTFTRVTITITSITHQSDHEDHILATIRLRNQI